MDRDIRDALEHARDVIEGRSRKKSSVWLNEPHLIHETSSVQMKNGPSAANHDVPCEVTVSRTTVVSQPNSEDEDFGSISDSDVYRSRTHSIRARLSAGSDDEGPRMTKLTYRRKRGGDWKKVGAAEIKKEAAADEDELEVNVKEELSGAAGHVITTTYDVKWTVMHFEHLPSWLQDNEFLRHGHRPPLPSFAECFKSIWSLHTETGNIWTHLLGCVAFFLLAVWFLTRPENHIQLQEKVVFSFFFVGAILCLGLSFAFHTLSCHSVGVVKIFCKLDYMGISLLIIGSFIPWIYYGFYCRREPKITYIAMVCILGAAAITVSMWDKFSESRFRPLRAGVFVAMGCSGVVPTVHYIITDGVHSLFNENSFHWLLLMAALYLIGAGLYATRTPERFFPGKCDIWFQSHQLFHTCVVIAAFVHYYGISEMAMARLNQKCPAELDATDANPFIHPEL
ncbi:unnamed protein product, partial [Mesorhabditis spiculigera]